ncbi:MAG: hypothetical protein MUP90_03645 [Gammaproteobacteria bacterium]|nr:hypothetical protein [Gammaproteobacteria bacterium]
MHQETPKRKDTFIVTALVIIIAESRPHLCAARDKYLSIRGDLDDASVLQRLGQLLVLQVLLADLVGGLLQLALLLDLTRLVLGNGGLQILDCRLVYDDLRVWLGCGLRYVYILVG